MPSIAQTLNDPESIFSRIHSLNFGLIFLALIAVYASIIGSLWVIIRLRGGSTALFGECMRLSLVALPLAIIPPAFFFLLGRAYWQAFTAER